MLSFRAFLFPTLRPCNWRQSILDVVGVLCFMCYVCSWCMACINSRKCILFLFGLFDLSCVICKSQSKRIYIYKKSWKFVPTKYSTNKIVIAVTCFIVRKVQEVYLYQYREIVLVMIRKVCIFNRAVYIWYVSYAFYNSSLWLPSS